MKCKDASGCERDALPGDAWCAAHVGSRAPQPQPSGEVLVRLSVELPAGVVIKTRSTMPRLEAFGGLLHSFFKTENSSEYRGSAPVVLELEFPERLRSTVDGALQLLRTVGRIDAQKGSSRS